MKNSNGTITYQLHVKFIAYKLQKRMKNMIKNERQCISFSFFFNPLMFHRHNGGWGL